MNKEINGVEELLNHIKANKDLRNDAALSRLLHISQPVISNLRAGRIKIGPAVILKIHEATAMPVVEIKSLAGIVSL
jgi:antitoxin HigA-1